VGNEGRGQHEKRGALPSPPESPVLALGRVSSIPLRPVRIFGTLSQIHGDNCTALGVREHLASVCQGTLAEAFRRRAIKRASAYRFYSGAMHVHIPLGGARHGFHYRGAFRQCRSID
jgi:hypothetical protein